MAEKYGSTPESLVEETVRLVQEVLSDLKKAKAREFKSKRQDNMMSLSISCVSEDMSDYVRKLMEEEGGDKLIVRDDYRAEHPAVIDVVVASLRIIAEKGGLAQKQTEPWVEPYKDDEFMMGCTRGTTFLSSVGYTFPGTPGNAEKLHKSFDISGDEIRSICLQGLKDNFSEMAKFEKELAENAIDVTLAQEDPQAFVQALQSAGMKNPAVVEVGTPKPKNKTDRNKLH